MVVAPSAFVRLCVLGQEIIESLFAMGYLKGKQGDEGYKRCLLFPRFKTLGALFRMSTLAETGSPTRISILLVKLVLETDGSRKAEQVFMQRGQFPRHRQFLLRTSVSSERAHPV